MKAVLAIFALMGPLGSAAWADASPSPLPAERILMIGDSHTVGTFGHTVDASLRAALPHAQLTVYGASSATPDYYFYGTSSHGGFYEHSASGAVFGITAAHPDQPTPKLSDLLKQTQVTVAVIALGTNLLRNPLDGARAQIVRAIQTVKDHGARCIWVGGPDERFVTREVQDDLYKILKSATDETGCTLIDSRKYTHYPDAGGGGIHYDDIWVTDSAGKRVHVGVTMAEEWAKKVTAEILGILGH
jgi:hypothetical protein